MWYLVWRAVLSLSTGWWYCFSIPVLLAEVWGFLATLPLLACLWWQTRRPPRRLADVEPRPERYPSVDVYVVCYSGARCCGPCVADGGRGRRGRAQVQ